MVNEELAVSYHQQDTDYYCGAACAQMVLHSVGEPLLSQDDLYNDNHTNTTEASSWSTPPDGLQWTLNHRQYAGKYFALDSLSDEDALSRMLCWTIHFWKVAPVALVQGGNHWVVAHGYTASAAPGSSVDTSYAISSFDLRNPWPQTPTPGPPPPHTDGDLCGTGGDRSVADVNVSYASWQVDYMTANVFGTRWLGRYVAVCDPAPPPTGGERAALRPQRPFDGDRLLTANEVRDALPRLIEHAGLLEHPRWADVLVDAEPGEPALVQRLSVPDSYYWLVPTFDRERRPRAVLSFDARFGTYQSAMDQAEPAVDVDRFREPDEIVGHLLDNRIELPARAGRLVVRPEGLSIHPALVWKSCRQSLSPFYPFRLITVGPWRLYLRIWDGALFTSLLNDRGGI